MTKNINKDVATGKKLGAMMDESKIDAIAKRETTKEKMGLSEGGPKTLEGKKNSLRNLRVPTKPIDIEDVNVPDIENLPDKDRIPLYYLGSYKILNEEEQALYLRKWLEYTDDFEMNQSSDEAQLNNLIMEELIYNRLVRSQLTNPHEDLSRQISECTKRHSDALKSLGISRTQRLGSKAGKDENIATLIQDFDSNKDDLVKEGDEALLEEEALLKQKRMHFEEELEEINTLDEPQDRKEEAIKPHKSGKDIKKEVVQNPVVVDELRDILGEAALQ